MSRSCGRLSNSPLMSNSRTQSYRQHPLASTLLRNGDRLDRRGKVASRAHSIPNPIEVALQIGIELLDGPTIHASRAAIGFDRFISFVHTRLGRKLFKMTANGEAEKVRCPLVVGKALGALKA